MSLGGREAAPPPPSPCPHSSRHLLSSWLSAWSRLLLESRGEVVGGGYCHAHQLFDALLTPSPRPTPPQEGGGLRPALQVQGGAGTEPVFRGTE